MAEFYKRFAAPDRPVPVLVGAEATRMAFNQFVNRGQLSIRIESAVAVRHDEKDVVGRDAIPLEQRLDRVGKVFDHV